ncbi:hypothetical protein ACFQZZ_23800 [Nocardia sp. GCM10030253]|uniref:hypothetical protein n=1 Tax=Nocardia sp. GCM10030253 TaxID=3273404 RepID=UPI0036332438
MRVAVVGLFRDVPQRDSAEMPRDAAFGFLSEGEGSRLRATVYRAFAERGYEVTVFGTHVTDDSGNEFGLFNIAAACHNATAGPEVWSELIERHVELVLRSIDSTDERASMPTDELWSLLYPKMVGDDQLNTGGDEYSYAPELSPGLHAALALDMPDSVHTLPWQSLTDIGDLEQVRARAMDNLRALPIDQHDVIEDEDGTQFDVVVGDSYLTASWALLLDELVAKVGGAPLGDDGALLAVPFRHLVAFHAIEGPRLIPSLNAMAGFAAAEYADQPGSISPYVFWWRRGRWTQLTRIDDEGLAIVVDEEFHEVLERMVGE